MAHNFRRLVRFENTSPKSVKGLPSRYLRMKEKMLRASYYCCFSCSMLTVPAVQASHLTSLEPASGIGSCPSRAPQESDNVWTVQERAQICCYRSWHCVCVCVCVCVCACVCVSVCVCVCHINSYTQLHSLITHRRRIFVGASWGMVVNTTPTSLQSTSCTASLKSQLVNDWAADRPISRERKRTRRMWMKAIFGLFVCPLLGGGAR